ncbi:hypothetical protein A2716_00760 [candidate division WWE3 bacterium RIFCSPHIGHO2_01_FULL_40_23]|uniref:Uncharacterized protein n=1 Tax=candidate division WWE3 bacterium RIFCSPLOWO2_01_FULL_41_18 TaxID=1802625 RepID=A0A1F4VFP5_UNCKA|nr:MAG: hypothetical protein A2716_00760 [candidate division WWE3 bacterium RIFCSPHIGHO2_01_FULL_40_23]OGC55523.1 MAG: hypothetical protein A3A78_01030 [candidate division WWE3 bacterium RIFCSPLOWO2_01_FULL_41_18]
MKHVQQNPKRGGVDLNKRFFELSIINGYVVSILWPLFVKLPAQFHWGQQLLIWLGIELSSMLVVFIMAGMLYNLSKRQNIPMLMLPASICLGITAGILAAILTVVLVAILYLIPPPR